MRPQASDEEDFGGKTEGAMKFERLEIRVTVRAVGLLRPEFLLAPVFVVSGT